MLTSRQDLRVAQRHVIANERICSVAFENSTPETIGNLSYGGFNLLLPNTKTEPSIQPAANGRHHYNLTFLGSKTKGEAIRVYSGVNSWGFSFCHDDATLLIFLNPFLEKMRLGSSMMRVPTELKKDKYKEEGWECFHGDGPVDLRMQSKDNKLIEGILSFRVGEDYFDLIYKDEKFSTRSNIDKEGVAARMAKSNEPTPESLRHAVCILAGLCGDKGNPDASLMLNAALDKLGV